jgi:hypothetical protein
MKASSLILPPIEKMDQQKTFQRLLSTYGRGISAIKSAIFEELDIFKNVPEGTRIDKMAPKWHQNWHQNGGNSTK